MKRVVFKTNEAVANKSGTMEAETISKNGRSSKSKMSRVKPKKNLFLFIAILGVFEATSAFAQNLKLDELLLFQKNNLVYIENYLSRKGWELHRTSIDNTDYFGDLFTQYNAITWSYKKNQYNDKAEAWFNLYQYGNLDNAVIYQMGKEHFIQLKTELQNSLYFKLIKTEAIDEGLETQYISNNLQIILKQYYQKSRFSDAPVHYLITIFNYKEIEKQVKLAQERKQREYDEQLRIERENQMREEKYQNLIRQADNFERLKNYTQAKLTYQNALTIKPEEKDIQNKIVQIDIILQFLNERKNKTYNYSESFTYDYESINRMLISEIKTILFNEKNLTPAKITITANIDTIGVTTTNLVSTISDTKINEKLEKISDNIKLKQPTKNGYTVFAKAIFEYTISADEAMIKVDKNANGFKSDSPKFTAYHSDISNALNSAPMGKFTFHFNKVTVNGNDFLETDLLKYNGTGGSSNALLSLLVPGLGDHRVSYGRRKGIGIALSTYGLIGAGVGLKLYSNSEYKKYHSATEQLAMDDHYQNANFSNQAFYACVGAGAIIWISDIIWVWSKGAKNKKAQKVYKQSNLAYYYEPNLNVSGLSYTINF